MFALREACRSADDMKALGLSPGLEGKRLVVQGLGNVGYHAAKFCREQGAIIVALAEREGAIHEPEGLERRRGLQAPQARPDRSSDFPAPRNPAQRRRARARVRRARAGGAGERVDLRERRRASRRRSSSRARTARRRPKRTTCSGRRACWSSRISIANAGGVTVSYFEWLKNLSHVRFGRMDRRRQAATELRMLQAIEMATGKTFTEAERQEFVKVTDELAIVNSGLEDTMIVAYQDIREALRAEAQNGRPAHGRLQTRDRQSRSGVRRVRDLSVNPPQRRRRRRDRFL